MKFASSKDAMKSAVDGVHQVFQVSDFNELQTFIKDKETELRANRNDGWAYDKYDSIALKYVVYNDINICVL